MRKFRDPALILGWMCMAYVLATLMIRAGAA